MSDASKNMNNEDKFVVDNPEDDLLEDNPVHELLGDKPEDELLANNPENDLLANNPENEVLANNPENEVLANNPENELLANNPENEVLANNPENEISRDNPEGNDTLLSFPCQWNVHEEFDTILVSSDGHKILTHSHLIRQHWPHLNEAFDAAKLTDEEPYYFLNVPKLDKEELARMLNYLYKKFKVAKEGGQPSAAKVANEQNYTDLELELSTVLKEKLCIGSRSSSSDPDSGVAENAEEEETSQQVEMLRSVMSAAADSISSSSSGSNSEAEESETLERSQEVNSDEELEKFLKHTFLKKSNMYPLSFWWQDNTDGRLDAVLHSSDGNKFLVHSHLIMLYWKKFKYAFDPSKKKKGKQIYWYFDGAKPVNYQHKVTEDPLFHVNVPQADVYYLLRMLLYLYEELRPQVTDHDLVKTLEVAHAIGFEAVLAALRSLLVKNMRSCTLKTLEDLYGWAKKAKDDKLFQAIEHHYQFAAIGPEDMRASDGSGEEPTDQILTFSWQSVYSEEMDTVLLANDKYNMMAHSFLIREHWEKFNNAFDASLLTDEDPRYLIAVPQLKGSELKIMLSYLYIGNGPTPKSLLDLKCRMDQAELIGFTDLQDKLRRMLVDSYSKLRQEFVETQDLESLKLLDKMVVKHPIVDPWPFDSVARFLNVFYLARVELAEKIITDADEDLLEEMIEFFNPYMRDYRKTQPLILKK